MKTLNSDKIVISMKHFIELRRRKALNLQRYMKLYNFKQTQVAEILGTKDSNVSKMKDEKATITDRTIDILCQHVNISSSFFFESPEEPLHLDAEESHIIKRIRERPGMKRILLDMSDSLYKSLPEELTVNGTTEERGKKLKKIFEQSKKKDEIGA